MAVFRNYYYYYNRRTRWSFAKSCCCLCLFLLCTTIITLIDAEKVRHHHIKINDDDDQSISQIERYSNNNNHLVDEESISGSSSTSDSTATLGCPNCRLFSHDDGDDNVDEKSETDKLRLEAIKRQILQKLGLRQKPNVTHSLPKEVVWETLYRAGDDDVGDTSDFFNRVDNGGVGGGGGGGDSRFFSSTTSARSSGNTMETVDVDDFYGRTSEIIAFAEEGSQLNKNRLLQFRAAVQDSGGGGGQMGQELRVRAATLWLKADFIRPSAASSNHDRRSCRSTDIFVFKIISNRLPESVTLSSRQFDRIAAEPVSMPLEESRSGWQKIDLTDMVQRWLSDANRQELRLFVDCSCCSNWHIHLFNNEKSKISSPNRPFLVIHTDPSTAKRVRKRAIDCSVDSGNQCCKQRFYVSFKALGWDDWVIAPHGYFANYCRGDCGHHRTPDTYITYHTHVIEEVRKTQHLSGMTPCCAPLKFSSMSLIYYGPDSTIIKRDLPKMVVDECGCP